MATTQFAFSSPPRSSLSSSPLPSPGAVIRQFCRATNTKTKTEPDVYDIPDDDEPPVEKPPAKSTATAERKVAELVIKKPRAPTVKKKTAKKTVDDGTKSKYFMELEEPEKGEPQKPKPARRLAVRKKATIATATDSVATTAAPPKARRKKVEPKDKAKTTVAPEAPVIEAAPAPETTTIESSPVRRRVWTPPVEDTIVISSGIEKEGEPKQTTSFIKIGDLAYKPASPQEGAEPVPNIKTATGAPASPRKRRIEMVDLPSKPKAAPEVKKPKKKAATLTERASAQYRKDVPPPSSQITGYFSTSKAVVGNSIKPKNALKPITTTKRKRGDEPETANLLSPTSARQRIDSQGFVFGTCSQLENEQIGADDAYPLSPLPENSADTMRDIPSFDPTIVGASYGGGLWNAAKRDQAGGLLRNEDLNFGHIQGSRRTTPSASPPATDEARKLDQEHEHAEPVVPSQPKYVTIDLTLSSSPVPIPKTTERLRSISPSSPLSPVRPLSSLSPLLSRGPTSPRRSLSPTHSIASSVGLDSLTDRAWRSVTKSISEPLLSPTLPISPPSPVRTQTRSFSTSSAPAAGARRTPTPTKATRAKAVKAVKAAKTVKATKAAAVKTAVSKAPATKKPRKAASPPPAAPECPPPEEHPGMPDFNSYLTTRLRSELAKFGFKKIGAKAAMVTCMEKCWLAQNAGAQAQADVQAQEEEEAVSQPSPRARAASPATATAKRTRARSTSASASLKPRSRASKSPEAAAAKRTRGGKKKPAERTPQESLQLHGKIAEAVRTNGNVGDTTSFYFRILMYDPIILEELLAWLNMVGLRSVGVLEEVGAADVRAWCDKNGVCLASEVTQRGRERKRF